MRKFITSLFLLIVFAGFMYSFYMEGYLDQTPLYDIIYAVSHFGEEKIASPIAEGNMLSFYPDENIGIECDGESIRVNGFTKDAYKSNLLIRIEENDREILKEAVRTGKDGSFSCSIRIPKTSASMVELSVFANSQNHGTFKGWVSDYLFFEHPGGVWQMSEPLVYEHNAKLFTMPKASGAATKSTRNIQADNPSVKAAAERITADCTTDYEKAAAIHDYICDNFYYDYDMASRDVVAIESAADILASKRGVCSGFANAYAALCRSAGLSCVVVTGYALGMNTDDIMWDSETALIESANHAWNEVYADGRWIIVDTTWDCGNAYRNGHIDEENGTNHLFFDANLKYFSVNHKILKYKDI